MKSTASCQEILVLANMPCFVGTTARKNDAALSSTMEDVEETATGLKENYRHMRIIYYKYKLCSYFVFQDCSCIVLYVLSDIKTAWFVVGSFYV